MPILFSSFPGWQKIRDVEVGAGGATRIDLTDLNIAIGALCMLVFYGGTDSGVGANISLYSNDDEVAGDYNTTRVLPVVNVMTQSTANNAVILAPATDLVVKVIGYVSVLSTLRAEFIGHGFLGSPDAGLTTFINSDLLPTAGVITKLSLVASVANWFYETTRVVLFKKV